MALKRLRWRLLYVIVFVLCGVWVLHSIQEDHLSSPISPFEQQKREAERNKPFQDKHKPTESNTNIDNEKVRDVESHGNHAERQPEKKKRLETSTKKIVKPTIKLKPGPGENGAGVYINVSTLTEEEKKRYDLGFKKNSFNEFASDLVSLHRKVPDLRPAECRNTTFPNLLQTSVIITFYNEAWSTLVRSVHSVLDRSPEKLIKEIILVDDGSNSSILGKPLNDYMQNFPKVRIIRSEKRHGLTGARLRGYEAATAPILTYLDSHIECANGWLEPLLYPITKDYRTVTYPALDVIGDENMAYRFIKGNEMYGVFRWRNLLFNWNYIPASVKKLMKTPYDNVRSPTMPGGLFSISKLYFTEIGTYDPGFIGWGGENIELSFKIWMCNGTLLMVPCSHVGHIFRKKMPYDIPGKDTVWKNSVRVAEVWMDDYKHYFYDFYQPSLEGVDVSERKKLREQLHCKNFDWYYKNFLAETLWLPDNFLSKGWVESLSKNNYCLDSMKGDGVFGLYQCLQKNPNQNFYYTLEGLIKTEVQEGEPIKCVSCFTRPVSLRPCDLKCKYQKWKYQDNRFFNPATNKCLAIPADRSNLGLEVIPCNDETRTKWKINFNKSTI